MKKIMLVGVFCMPFLNSCGRHNEKDLVRAAFRGYKVAVLAEDYITAVNILDAPTINNYQKLSDEIKYGDSMSISSFPLIDRMTILIVRGKASKKEIMAFDGKSLFVFSAQYGLGDKDKLMHWAISEVNIDGNFATGVLETKEIKELLAANKIEKKDVPLFTFRKQNGEWKFNLTSLMRYVEPAIIKSAATFASENEFLFEIVKKQTEKIPDAEIWTPIEPRKQLLTPESE